MTTSCDQIRERLAEGGPASLQSDKEAQEHLVACAACFAFLEALEEVDHVLAEMPLLDAPDAPIEATLKATLKATATVPVTVSKPVESAPVKAKKSWLRSRSLVLGGALSAAAIILLIAVSTIFVSAGRAPSDGDYARLKATGEVAMLEVPPPPPPLEPQRKPAEIREHQALNDVLKEGGAVAEDRSDRAFAEPSKPVVVQTAPLGGSVIVQKQIVLGKDGFEPRSGAKTGELEVDEKSKPKINLRLEPEAKEEKKRDATTTPRTPPGLDERVNDLKDRIFRSKAQLSLLPETVTPERSSELAESNESGVVAGKVDSGKHAFRVRRDGDDVTEGTWHSDPKQELDRERTRDVHAALTFLEERDSLDNLAFKDAVGYWANTYVPGDQSLRLLQARILDQRSRLSGDLKALPLDNTARQYAQPFDAPESSALAVYLHTDRQHLQGQKRALIQVGLKGTPRHGRRRPNMNVGLLLDLRGEAITTEAGASIRALVSAFGDAQEIGDRFSITVAGKPGGVIVPPDNFKRGPITVALQKLFEPAQAGSEPSLSVAEAFQAASASIGGETDESAPLGASAIILVTNAPLGSDADVLSTIAHASAVGGVPVSVIGVGSGVVLEELDRITLAGQGNRRLISSAAEAVSLVDRELSAASRVVARAVRLRIRLGPNVRLIDVLGSRRLDEEQAERVRQAEQSIDRRLSKSLGIQSDRGEDEEGIQIVIPSFYAGDAHVILLDVVIDGPGSVADVTVRYKDLVHLKNGLARTNLALHRGSETRGPLEHNVLKNLVGYRTSVMLREAGELVASGDDANAQAKIHHARNLIAGMGVVTPGWSTDLDFAAELRMFDAYASFVSAQLPSRPEERPFVADSLAYASQLKQLPRPKE